MTCTEIRQSFLDFFKARGHTIVPSASLLPDSPNLLFTNAGMNQFVPIFLDRIECPYIPGRVADTQKCIRAGGKHNDLEDVGLDTYHHTFFEMLGNWSFGDYFKKEAIGWAWELVVELWKFPPQRLYATVYQPDQTAGDPAERDSEAYDLWAERFRSVGLDPAIHIVDGGKKDNFWMMGDTGPCGPCTEMHVDLRPGPRATEVAAQASGAALVNGSDSRCIEIWNNVFIQYNANPDGSFSALPARHVDTGMGFERVCSIIQGTNGLTDFENARISNYETDVFRPIFAEIERLLSRNGTAKRYGSTLPQAGSTGDTEQERIDVAFRVIADHIRTLTFAIADGIQPGNTGRNYVLRRILRRAVRYGRTLGFAEPFFYTLVDVVALQFGDVFPEVRARRDHVKVTIETEEEAFNRTLDRGIALFEAEAERLSGTPISGTAASGTAASGTAGVPPAESGVPPDSPGVSPTFGGATRTKRRRLPHFEKPWAIYFVTVSTRNHRILAPPARTMVLNAITHFHNKRYELFATCVMPDHFHLLLQPWPKETKAQGGSEFWSLGELMHSIKGFTAKEINKLDGTKGAVWEEERYDRYIRGDSDLEEKFHYILENPSRAGIQPPDAAYAWVWTQWLVKYEHQMHGNAKNEPNTQMPAKEGDVGETPTGSGGTPDPAGGTPAVPEQPEQPEQHEQHVRPTTMSGEFAFQLYDTFGFPLDLTELMARERRLAVDTDGFEKLMDEQRARARAAQKRQIIALSEVETKEPTRFVGYDHLTADVKVLEVVSLKDRTAVVLDASAAYAEMGGQVGDTAELVIGGDIHRIENTQSIGETFLHFLAGTEAPVVGSAGRQIVDRPRRRAIERHHTVTHVFHWALHEVAGKEATQKGSFVGPGKLTFDFNSAPLTHAQLGDIERLVNDRIVANDPVSWTEVPLSEARANPRIMQLFGEKYSDIVRVVQIGGEPRALNGWSMELCGGTHTRHTGEIGLFHLVSEGAVAAGVRRIEAIAGLEAYSAARGDSELLKRLAGKVLAQGRADVEKKIDALIEQQKSLEKALGAARQREASSRAKALLPAAENHVLIASLGDEEGDFVMAVSEALRPLFDGIAVLGAGGGGSVSLVATVGKPHQSRIHAGKIIQAIAPLVGGKGGGKPDFARGGGKDVAKLGAALDEARRLVALAPSVA